MEQQFKPNVYRKKRHSQKEKEFSKLEKLVDVFFPVFIFFLIGILFVFHVLIPVFIWVLNQLVD